MTFNTQTGCGKCANSEGDVNTVMSKRFSQAGHRRFLAEASRMSTKPIRGEVQHDQLLSSPMPEKLRERQTRALTLL